MIPVSFVVPRDSHKEKTFAHVTAEVSRPELARERVFLSALRRAVSAWFLTTEEGLSAWDCSCQDFNVGDLSNCGDEALDALLAREGICQLSIDCMSADTSYWTFDKVLGPDTEDAGLMFPLPEFGVFVGTSVDRDVLYSAPILPDGAINPDEVRAVLAITPECLEAVNVLLKTEFSPEDFSG